MLLIEPVRSTSRLVAPPAFDPILGIVLMPCAATAPAPAVLIGSTPPRSYPSFAMKRPTTPPLKACRPWIQERSSPNCQFCVMRLLLPVVPGAASGLVTPATPG